MPRPKGDYEVVYVSRPREVVYTVPNRVAASRGYEDRSYVSDRYSERQTRTRTDYDRDSVTVREVGDDSGYDSYCLPSRGSRDYQSSRQYQPYSTEDRQGARYASSGYERRRRSSDDYTPRQARSPDEDYESRRDRGRRDEKRSSPARRLRSAMRGSRNDSPDTQRRARARSVSFRESEASKHDAGNQRHERPGYEARAVGQYLRHDNDDDLASETYANRRRARRYS